MIVVVVIINYYENHDDNAQMKAKQKSLKRVLLIVPQRLVSTKGPLIDKEDWRSTESQAN